MSRHRTKKHFGQHFLHDSSTIKKIMQAITVDDGDVLVEIGPGLGAITCPLLDAGTRLHCIEIDRDAVIVLQKKFSDRENLVIHTADALTFDFGALSNGDKLRLVGNLPYNISTPLLFHILKFEESVQDMHFMLQREVVERICASPGDAAYGRLTVMLAAHFKAEKLFLIKPGAFNPPPKVDSAFLRLTPLAPAPFEITDQDLFADVVRRAFSHRRKTLRNALRGLADTETLVACGLNPGLRPERIAPAEFAALANHLHDQAGSAKPADI
ncbi:MAG: 16S rRNA (adenine(1518)-N(6)/adenine(1519)-N(6))-dimethyltransferase RsmA [Gammaproteobacteria bacterium]